MDIVRLTVTDETWWKSMTRADVSFLFLKVAAVLAGRMLMHFHVHDARHFIAAL
jgi:hypothetical protein